MRNGTWILGISASPHNGAACLLHGDEIVVAIQEERLNRIKRYGLFGARHSLAIDCCLKFAGIGARDLNLVVCCVTNRTRIPEQDLSLNPILQTTRNQIPTLYIPHHLGHAMSAFATSGFEESAVLVVDGLGSPFEDFREDEKAACRWMVDDGWETISLYAASGTSLVPIEKQMVEKGRWLNSNGGAMPTFGSLGGMYSAVSAQIFDDGFDGPGKLMGLAPYGRPQIPADDFFDLDAGRFVFSDKVPNRFTHGDRWPLRQLEYSDLAASTQCALEQALLCLVDRLHGLWPNENLCYAGGVALNSVANERIIRESRFKRVYITPFAEDSGTAIGAAYYGLWKLTKRNSRRKLIHDAVGPLYSDVQIWQAVEDTPAVEVERADDILSRTVDLLCDGKIVAWFEGGSELGPRALGQRSILCDPRRPDAKEMLNTRVKYRESFRPFAPVILAENVADWFSLDGASPESPFMLRVCEFNEDKRDVVPAVVHVDGTGRFQTVTSEANGRFYHLLKKFYEKTGLPILLNTSFNVAGEPIVESPRDALQTLLSSGVDYCILSDTIVGKRTQILFEQNEIPWPARIRTQVAEALRVADAEGQEAPSASTANRPLKQYIGVFENDIWGKIRLFETNEDRLKADFGAWSMSRPLYGSRVVYLDRYHGDIFGINGGAFGGLRIAFLPDRRDRLNVMAVLRKAAANRSEVFFRTCDPDEAIGGYERFLGDYKSDGKLMQVGWRDGSLTVTVPGQPAFLLHQTTDTEFILKNLPGYSVHFRTDGFGSVAMAVVTHPSGIVRLKKT
jgi:carbamoyltransferase